MIGLVLGIVIGSACMFVIHVLSENEAYQKTVNGIYRHVAGPLHCRSPYHDLTDPVNCPEYDMKMCCYCGGLFVNINDIVRHGHE